MVTTRSQRGVPIHPPERYADEQDAIKPKKNRKPRTKKPAATSAKATTTKGKAAAPKKTIKTTRITIAKTVRVAPKTPFPKAKSKSPSPKTPSPSVVHSPSEQLKTPPPISPHHRRAKSASPFYLSKSASPRTTKTV